MGFNFRSLAFKDLELYVLDGTERQAIKDMDGNLRRPKIGYCCISDPFVMILREDDTLGLFVGDAERGRIRRKDMTPMGEKVRKAHVGINKPFFIIYFCRYLAMSLAVFSRISLVYLRFFLPCLLRINSKPTADLQLRPP